MILLRKSSSDFIMIKSGKQNVVIVFYVVDANEYILIIQNYCTGQLL